MTSSLARAGCAPRHGGQISGAADLDAGVCRWAAARSCSSVCDTSRRTTWATPWCEGTYRFFTRERLSPLARAWSALCAAAALAGIAAFLVSEYRGAHRADARLDEARALADRGDREGALAQYRAVLDEFRGQAASVERAVAGIAELAAGDVPAPCAAGGVEPVRRAALAVLTLAADVRSVTGTAALRTRLLACADEIGDTGARDALRVLDVAAELAEGRDAALDARRTDARRAYAA
ncbi:MAG: hypothetical protein HY908_16485, partial [Myxococcales bacterium]|nr:hypothetical protein [Myxococcales bacterium]